MAHPITTAMCLWMPVVHVCVHLHVYVWMHTRVHMGTDAGGQCGLASSDIFRLIFETGSLAELNDSAKLAGQ